MTVLTHVIVFLAGATCGIFLTALLQARKVADEYAEELEQEE